MTMRSYVCGILISTALTILPNELIAADIWPHSSSVLADVKVSRVGGPLAIKTRIGTVDALLVVDTGAESTIVDRAVLPEHLVKSGDVRLEFLNSKVEVPVFPCPDLVVAGIPCPWIKDIPAADLTTLRTVCGESFAGVLGMDFLSRYVVHLDLDNGQMLICNASLAGDPPADAIHLAIAGKRIPMIECKVGLSSVAFKIDTGCLGNGTIETHVAEKLLQEKAAGLTDGKYYVYDLDANNVISKIIKCHSFKLGKAECQGIAFDTHKSNSLGLYMLARMLITFDFTRNVAFVVPSKRMSALDRKCDFGLELAMDDDHEITVKRVTPKSLGDVSGFRAGDRIVAVDGLKVSDMKGVDFIRVFCFPTTDDMSFAVLRFQSTKHLTASGMWQQM